MKSLQSNQSARASEPSSSKPGRRGLVVGVGVAGAAAVAARALHRSAIDAPVAAAPGAAVRGEGYRLTPHVLRYYETTKA